MLRLLQNKLSNKALFFREIIVFVTFLHLFIIVLFCLIGFQGYNNEKFSIRTESKLSSTIVFLPLKKYADPAMNHNQKAGLHEKHQSRKVIDYQTYLKKQGYNVVPGGKDSAVKAVAKIDQKKTALSDKKNKSVEKNKAVAAESKTVEHKTVLKKIPKKTTAQKAAAKKVAVQKSASKKAVNAVAEPVKKIIEQAVRPQVAQEESKQVEVQVEPAEIAVEMSQATTSLQSAPLNIDLDNVTFVGYRELEKLQLQSKIQQAIETFWSPPVGMAKNTVCELQVVIDASGKVAHAKVLKSSKIMAFDLAARAAIHRTKFPKDVWDKQISIELGI